MDYRNKAVHCVKDTVLPLHAAQFAECGFDLDKQYEKYGNTEAFFAHVVEPGHRYEVGYPRCVCPEALSGKADGAAHCECSRQSVLFILESLLPNKTIKVDIIETVLAGADRCRFSVTVE